MKIKKVKYLIIIIIISFLYIIFEIFLDGVFTYNQTDIIVIIVFLVFFIMRMLIFIAILYGLFVSN